MSIQIAIQSLSAIKTIADGLVSMRDETKVLEVKLSLMQQVFEIRQVLDALQEEASTIKQENRQLKSEKLKMEQSLAEREQCELFQPATGVFVYASKPIEGKHPAAPYYCQACYDVGKKSVLAFRTALSSVHPATLQCPNNTHHVHQLPRGATPTFIFEGKRPGA